MSSVDFINTSQVIYNISVYQKTRSYVIIQLLSMAVTVP